MVGYFIIIHFIMWIRDSYIYTEMSTVATHTNKVAQKIYNQIIGIVKPPWLCCMRLTFADDKVFQLLEMLTPLEPLKRHEDVKLPRAENTGTWLLRLESYCHWRDRDVEEDCHVFCCYGIPGAGK